MTTRCLNCPLKGKDIFAHKTEEDFRQTEQFKKGELTVEEGTTLLMEGTNAPQLYTAIGGMGLRYKTLPNGRRQVINFVFPGDFIGLQAAVMSEMQHTVVASTDMRLCVFDRSEFMRFIRNHPERGFDITWLAAVEEHFLGDALVTVGQRTALERVAWGLLRLHERGEALGLTQGGVMPLPFRQQDFADAVGLSLVHTNKTLGKLRERQIATWRDGGLTVANPQALADIAEIERGNVPKRPYV
ncbi:MAG: Crp/Fnr family transcriptional regulator [Pseudomonadota bacterium]